MPPWEDSPDRKQEMVVSNRCCRTLRTPPFLLGTFLSCLLCKGAADNPSQNQAPSPVNGTQGSSVWLQIRNSSTGTVVDKIEWEFQPKGGSRSLTVVEFRDGIARRPNPSDRFGERLEAINETMLRIRDLQLEDTGVYEAKVRLSNAVNDKYTFSLTVHQPVPELQIRHQVDSHTLLGCNVTLRCVAAGPGEFSISWRRGSPPRSLAGGADWYQLSPNGTDLRLFWKRNSTDSSITCLVSSAVDQKGVSFDLRRICTEEGGVRPLQLGPFLSFVVVPILAGAVGIWLWKKRRKKSPHSAFVESSPAAGSPADPQYAEIAMKRRPEGYKDQDANHRSDQKYPTVYAQLNVSLPSSEQVT